MQNESRVGTGSASYEQTVAQRVTVAVIFKRIILLALYAFCGIALLLVGDHLKLVLLAAEIAALLIWMLVLFTWRLSKVEYEYVIFDGTLTVFRILGNRSRRRLCAVTVRHLSAVYPCEGDYVNRIESFGARRTVFAASAPDAEGLYAALWTDEKNRRRVLFFEPDDRALRIMRSQNITAVTLRKGESQ